MLHTKRPQVEKLSDTLHYDSTFSVLGGRLWKHEVLQKLNYKKMFLQKCLIVLEKQWPFQSEIHLSYP